MKIDIKKIPPEGFTLTEDISAQALGLETELIKFCSPVKIKALVSKITNAVTVALTVSTVFSTQCSRCLNDIKIDFQKQLDFNYPLNKSDLVIDLDEDVRQEIILDYPAQPLCVKSCKGLCPKCGKNLNEGGCSCGAT